jgi:hypothetical protein
MKHHHTKWIAATVAIAGGLALTGSVHAQAVTGDPTLDNVTPTAAYAQWAVPTTTISDGPAGLQVVSQAAYGSLYYAIPAGQQQFLNEDDTQATLTMTINGAGPDAMNNYWLGLPFILDDNAESQTYGGYLGEFGYFGAYSPATVVWNGNTVSETVPLDALQDATIAAGFDAINGFNVELDPAVLPPGPPFYSVTFDSLTLSSAPDEASTLALVAPVAAVLLGFRRRQK